MDTGSHSQVRLAASVALLVTLLAWESFAPFFHFFTSAARERARHAGRNLVLGLLNVLLNASVFVGLWWAAAAWAEAHRFGLLHWLAWPAWARLIGAFLLLDGWMYAWHRLNHRLPFLWRFHRVHHSDQKMDVTTANRFHLGEITLSGLLRAPVLALTGVQLWELAIYETAMFSVVQLHHANISLSAPVDRALRLLIVTPFMHKVHHSHWQPETDSNYSSLFSFWDRLFHSFRLNPAPHSLRFGLDDLSAPEHQTLRGLLTTPVKRGERKGVEESQTGHEPHA